LSASLPDSVRPVFDETVGLYQDLLCVACWRPIT
jgi:hypothetical protein